MNSFHLLVCVSLFISLSITASPPAGSINIASYGAKGDGSDSTQPIRDAINASSSGQVIWFPTGKYTISSTIVLQAHRIYQGDLNSILHTPNQNAVIFQANNGAANNLTFDGLTFDNGQVVIYTDSVYADGFHMTNCVFQNNSNNCAGQTNCPAPKGLFFSAGNGPSNAVISWNSFYNLQSYWTNIKDSDDDGASCCIGLYGGINVVISHNRFDLVQEGIKVYETNNLECQNIMLSDNYFTRVHRMGIETQCGKGNGWIYENNFFEDFNTPFWNTFGISARSDANYNVNLIQNTILMFGNPIGWYGDALEVNGDGEVNIIQNFVYGPHVGALTFCVQSTGWLNVTHNNVCNNNSYASIISTEYGDGCLTNSRTIITPNTWVPCLTESSVPTNYPPRPAAGAHQSSSLSLSHQSPSLSLSHHTHPSPLSKMLITNN